MKTVRNKQEGHGEAANPREDSKSKIKTDRPLAEKDEVKVAEEKLRKKTSKKG